MSEMFVPKIRKEFGQNPEEEKTAGMQDRLLEVMRFSGGDKKEKEKNLEAKKTLKEEYMQEYPEQSEGVEIIFGVKRFLNISSRLTRDREEGDPSKKLKKEDRLAILRELTEYQFLITHYLLSVSDKLGGKDFLKKFWRLSEDIAQETGNLKQFIGIKKGILGQVASYKVLEALGYNPKLPHPNLDAFYSVDLLTEKSMAVQVKSSSVEEPALLGIEDVDEIGVPAVITDQKGQKIFVNERHSEALQRFKVNLRRLSQETHEEYRGVEFIIPIKMIDENTGEPNQFVVKYFEKELEKRSAGRDDRELPLAA